MLKENTTLIFDQQGTISELPFDSTNEGAFFVIRYEKIADVFTPRMDIYYVIKDDGVLLLNTLIDISKPIDKVTIFNKETNVVIREFIVNSILDYSIQTNDIGVLNECLTLFITI